MCNEAYPRCSKCNNPRRSFAGSCCHESATSLFFPPVLPRLHWATVALQVQEAALLHTTCGSSVSPHPVHCTTPQGTFLSQCWAQTFLTSAQGAAHAIKAGTHAHTRTRVPCTHVTNHQCRCKCRSRYTNGDCSLPSVLKTPLAEGPRPKVVYKSPNAWNGPLPVKDVDEVGCKKTPEEGGCDQMRCDKSKTKHVKICTDVDDSGCDDSDCSYEECRSHCQTNEDLTSSHFAFDVGDRECDIFEGCIDMQSNKDYVQYALADATASATAALQEALLHTSCTWIMWGLLATMGKMTICKTIKTPTRTMHAGARGTTSMLVPLALLVSSSFARARFGIPPLLFEFVILPYVQCFSERCVYANRCATYH